MNPGFPPPGAFACVKGAARARPWKTLRLQDFN